jgi:hypothetical protein
MVLGFKDQFVPLVEDGSKTHSIRAGNRWRAEMRADLFARPRQKGMRLLFRAIVTRVERIEIFAYKNVPFVLGGNHSPGAHRGPNGEALVIRIDGILLDSTETEALLRRDGFRDKTLMASYEALMFWEKRLPFSGQLLHWDYNNRFSDIADTCWQLSRHKAVNHAKGRSAAYASR